MDDAPKLSVFLVCPIGAEGNPDRIRSDRLRKYVIDPVLATRADIVRADQIGEPGRITAQITRHIATADLVVADLTGLNANVMYELGLRHGLGRPSVLMAEKGQQLPFDLFDSRTIFYELGLEGAEAARAALEKHVARALEGVERVIPAELLDRGEGTGSDVSATGDILSAVLDSSSRVQKEVIENRRYLEAVWRVLSDKQQERAQEMGMRLLSGVLNQGMEHPDRLEKFMDVVNRMKDQTEKLQRPPDGSGSSGHSEGG